LTNYHTPPTGFDTIVSSFGMTGPARKPHQHTDCMYNYHTEWRHENYSNEIF